MRVLIAWEPNMDKLTSALHRLYLIGGQFTDAAGQTRALTIDFHKAEGEQHWTRLCDVANALQKELGLPAPAVSVSGGDAYRLWLSLARPVSAEAARRFLALLHTTYFPDEQIDLGRSDVPLPPSLNEATGLWAAFVNPSMGGALADDLGLEMAPPDAAQSAFLDNLDSITEEQFAHALATLQRKHDAPPAPPPMPPRDAVPPGLLLKDASLEDIVRRLHAMGIEPTFRHILKS